MLKLLTPSMVCHFEHAAASARLCVETQATLALDSLVSDAAASARLCVETKNGSIFKNKREPAAASARLCVETEI